MSMEMLPEVGDVVNVADRDAAGERISIMEEPMQDIINEIIDQADLPPPDIEGPKSIYLADMKDCISNFPEGYYPRQKIVCEPDIQLMDYLKTGTSQEEFLYKEVASAEESSLGDDKEYDEEGRRKEGADVSPNMESIFGIDQHRHNFHKNLFCEIEGGSRLTGIMCSMGPSTMDQTEIFRMIKNGMGLVRLNMAYGSPSDHTNQITLIRTAALEFSNQIGMSIQLAIAMEVRGPEIRTGKLVGQPTPGKTIPLEAGQRIQLIAEPEYEFSCNEDQIYIDYPNLLETLVPGDKLDIYGGISLVVDAIAKLEKRVLCTITSGGALGSYKPVIFHEVPLELNFISDNTESDLQLAIECEVDFIIMKRVRCAAQVKAYRHLLGEHARKVQIIAKIETVQGLDNIDDILELVDAVMCSMKDLTAGMPMETAIAAQRFAMGRCIKARKPFISSASVAYESYKEGDRDGYLIAVSTVSDLVNHGVSCIVLNADSAVGSSPSGCVKLLAQIVEQSEQTLWQRQLSKERRLLAHLPTTPDEAIAMAAVEVALKVAAKAIIALTFTGNTVILLSRYVPRCPIIGITDNARVACKINLWRAVRPIYYQNQFPTKDRDDKILNYGIAYGKRMGFIKACDPVVLITGASGSTRLTNSIRLHYVTMEDSVHCPPKPIVDVFTTKEIELPSDDPLKLIKHKYNKINICKYRQQYFSSL